MKKFTLMSIVMLCFLFTACKNEADYEKMCRIEIISEEEPSIIKIIGGLTQAETADFFDEDEWTEAAENKDELLPEYRIILYQEKTKTLIKLENSEDYEKIAEYVTYEDSACVKQSLGSELIRGKVVSDDMLTFYYNGTDKFFKNLQEAVNTGN